jgi:hypothetical protein
MIAGRETLTPATRGQRKKIGHARCKRSDADATMRTLGKRDKGQYNLESSKLELART